MAVESKYDPKDMVHPVPATSPIYFSNLFNPQIFRHLGPTGLKVSLFSLGVSRNLPDWGKREGLISFEKVAGSPMGGRRREIL